MEHESGHKSIIPREGEVEHSVIELNGVVSSQVPKSKRRVNLDGIPTVKSLSSGQMESLTSICDTFLPSINLSGNVDDSVHTFYKTCASMAGNNEHVGVLIGETLKHPLIPLLLLTLWMLSTWYGTFLLCGKASLSIRFPFFHKFSQLPQKKREQIFLSWSLSFFYPMRMFFRTLKYLTMLVFFSQAGQVIPGESLRRHSSFLSGYLNGL